MIYRKFRKKIKLKHETINQNQGIAQHKFKHNGVGIIGSVRYQTCFQVGFHLVRYLAN